jgi:hypothetical protein
MTDFGNEIHSYLCYNERGMNKIGVCLKTIILRGLSFSFLITPHFDNQIDKHHYQHPVRN